MKKIGTGKSLFQIGLKKRVHIILLGLYLYVDDIAYDVYDQRVYIR